jgi:predicted MFS family arabinose efflux permease
MGVLVPVSIRPRFFGSRNRTLQVGAIAGLIVGACLLEFASHWTNHQAWARASLALGGEGNTKPAMRAFCVLFALAGIARAISAYYLALHIEPRHAASSVRPVPLRELLQRLRTTGLGKLILALSVCQCAMMVGSPFWVVYAKERAGATFLEWAGLVAIWFLGKALAMTHAGHIAKTKGRRSLLLTAWAMMIPIPILWAMSTNLVWLAVAQLLAGVAIAMWESATWLSVLESSPEKERTSLLAKYQFLQWGASTMGSVLGGWMLQSIAEASWAFAVVFAASAVLRLGAWGLLKGTSRHIHEPGFRSSQASGR